MFAIFVDPSPMLTVNQSFLSWVPIRWMTYESVEFRAWNPTEQLHDVGAEKYQILI